MKDNHAPKWLIGISNPNGDGVTDHSTYFFRTNSLILLLQTESPSFFPSHSNASENCGHEETVGGLGALRGITTQGSATLKPIRGKCNFKEEEQVQ